MGPRAARLWGASPAWRQVLHAQVPRPRQTALAHYRPTWSPWTPEQARKEASATRRVGHRQSPSRQGTGDGRRKVASITHSDVVELLQEVQGEDRTKRAYIANRVRAALGRFFRWAISEAMILVRPCRRHGAAAGRDEARARIDGRGGREGVEGRRRLSLRRHHSLAAGDGATTQRGRRMRRSGLHLDARMWRLPKERTKGNRDHVVPLNDLALEVLKTCPRIKERDCIFARGRKRRSRDGEGETPARCEMWCAGLAAARLAPDRRHQDAGRGGVAAHRRRGAQPRAAGLFGVTAVYLRDRQEEAKHAAMDTWNGQLACVLARAREGVSPTGT